VERYQIITDATADLTEEYLRELGVDMIPMELDLDGQPFTFLPGRGNITPEEFYDALHQGRWGRTSQINPAVYESYFESYLSQGIDLIYLCFSSGLSGTVQTARVCMEQLAEKYPQRKLLCIDSLCASVGEGFLVAAAAQRQKMGMGLCDLGRWLEENRLKVCHWFTVDDLQHLRRGGRVSSATAIMGTALQIKPVMHVDNEGHLINVSKVQGRKKALAALVQRMTASWTPELGRTVLIGQGGCPEDGQYVADLVKKAHPNAEVSVLPIGPVIGAHTGPGVVRTLFRGSQR
jgi:DegV family protein with EDD domain